MSIPSAVLDYLAGVQGAFRLYNDESNVSVLEAAANEGIRPEQLALALLIKHHGSPLMVIMRADQELDSELLAERIGAVPELCSREECAALCAGSDNEWLAPLPEVFGLRAVCNVEFGELEKVFFPAGSPGQFMQTSGSIYQSLLTKVLLTDLGGGKPLHDSPLSAASAMAADCADDIAVQFPAMPPLAEEIARVRDNPYSQPSELVAIIQQDINLSGQLVHYAATPLFDGKGRATSLEQTITQVMDLDLAIDLSLGLALTNAVAVAGSDNDLQLHHDYWERALYSAMLTHQLCNAIDYYRRPASGFAFLAGLLSNLGQLLLLQHYPDYQQRLISEQACNPELSLLDLEHRLFGINHIELGVRLMEKWHMPREVVLAVQHHHDAICSGDYAIYANLAILANRLLTRYGLGDAATDALSDELLQAVELDSARAESALATVMATGTEGIAFHAGRMAA